MQTPKTRATPLEVPRRASPATPRTARQLNKPVSESESISSPHPGSKTPKNRSPKVVERRSPRSPVPEVQKKRPTRVPELELQLAQLQEELKKTKNQLSSAELSQGQAHQEAEASKQLLAATSVKLEESQKQLLELSASEATRVEELHKISQDQERAWQSELEAHQKHHLMDSAALAAATNEIHKLEVQLERNAESEAACDEIQGLRSELSETLLLLENFKTQLEESKESEIKAKEDVCKAEMQLETAKARAENLRSEGLKAMEAYRCLAFELEQSKARVNLLEGLVSKLQNDSGNTEIFEENGENEESKALKTELSHAKYEVGQLISALDAAERKYQEDYVQSTLAIRSAYESAERTKSESNHREAELDLKLKQAEADIEELKDNLIAQETKIQNLLEENKGLTLKLEENHYQEGDKSTLDSELKKSEACLDDLKVTLLDKETELQSITEENEMLKMEVEKREMEMKKVSGEAISVAEAAKASEREALMKLGYMTEEAEKSSRKAVRVTEQLDAAQAANAEIEAELKRLKVQSDQWRKAAEAAAAMISSGNNGKLVERTGSLDYHSIGAKIGSPFLDDMDEESPKKKNGNVLRKLGVLLKKGQK